MRPSARRWGRRLINRLDEMVERTPADRERYVDFLRVFSIAVVIIWHWSLSVIFWDDDRFVMPNPINHVPGGWLYTWLLQIVPVFFIVGGYANYASWQASRRRGQAWPGFLRHRLARLLTPVLVFGVVWLAFELAAHAIIPGYPGVLSYAWMVFTPLWFVAAYAGVVALVPVTAALHLRAKWAATGGLAAAVIVADTGRFALDVEAFGWLNSAMAWVLIHQFGYFYRDGTLRRLDHAGAAGLAVVGAGMLAAITTLGPYPRSMVATPGQEFSNILPTTMAIPAVGLLQLGILLLVRDRVSRWLQKVEVWRVVIAANSVILTVFVWHMTALLMALVVYRAVGGEPLAFPSLAWWDQRWFWLVAPALVLAPLVAVFGRFETSGLLRSRGRAQRRTR
ncbi:MAG TPA: acyltransferase [Jiangellaceae bacterium]|nr:acyltransferase [Jiangellaceae bacterium]